MVPKADCVTCGAHILFQERIYQPDVVAYSARCEKSQDHEIPAEISALVYEANRRQGIARHSETDD